VAEAEQRFLRKGKRLSLKGCSALEEWLKNPQKAPVVRRYQLGILRD
jgi:hypothetical protein